MTFSSRIAVDDRAGVERARGRHEEAAAEERVPHREREAEAVEDGQAAEHRHRARQDRHRGDLRAVGEEVPVREDDPLGVARAPAREEEGRLLPVPVVREAPMSSATHWLGRSHAAASQGSIARLPPAAWISAARSTVRLGPWEVGEAGAHRVRRDDRPHAGRGAMLDYGGRPAGSEVEVHGHLAGAHDRQVRDRARRRPAEGRSPTRLSGTVSLRWRDSAAAAAISCAAVSTRRPEVRSTIARCPAAGEAAHDLAPDVPAKHGPLVERQGPELHQGLARGGAIRALVRDRLPKRDAHGRRQQARGLPEVLVPREGEHGSPETVDGRRDNRDPRPLGDLLKPAVQDHELARARNPPIRGRSIRARPAPGPLPRLLSHCGPLPG